MKVNSNKKGFTLIELLAVIVVLALIMILAVPQILTVMNDSKKKVFQQYAARLIESATSVYDAKKLIGENIPTKYNNMYCLKPVDMGITATGNYKAVVVINPSNLVGANGLNLTTYYIYMTDGTYAYNNTLSNDVQNDPTKISIAQSDIDAVTTAINQCVVPTTTP